MYFFVPKDFKLEEEYNKGFKVNEIFNIFNVGVVTSNDAVLVNSDANILRNNVERIRTKDYDKGL